MDKAVMTIAVLVPISMFALIFGIFYLRAQQRMGMIERGMDPRSSVSKPFNHSYTLTAGLLIMGAGLGLFLADLISQYTPEDYNATAIYMSLTALFGGAGLITAYFIEKKSPKGEDKG